MKTLLFFFGLLLPLHGGISVFLPGPFSYWKELFLGIFGLVVLVEFIQNKTNLRSCSNTEKTSIGLLLLLIVLVLFSVQNSYALLAARYLALPFLCFLVFSRFFTQQNRTKVFHIFSTGFFLGLTLSVLFGVIIQFSLWQFPREFFSQTISSWVPGQTIPLFHQAHGIPRMQGLSSGPIEFSHLLFLGLCVLPFWRKNTKWIRAIFCTIFLFGIFFSASRAAIIASIIFFVFWGIQYFFQEKNRFTLSKSKKIKIASLILILGGIFVFSQKNNIQTLLQRPGTLQHFSRPLRTIQEGFTHFFRGNLAKSGPAARLQNLTEKNNDQALLPENIFADYFFQTGIFGLLLVLSFWGQIFQKLRKNFIQLGLFLGFLVLANLAGIFDMTPISLTFGIVTAFFVSKKESKQVL